MLHYITHTQATSEGRTAPRNFQRRKWYRRFYATQCRRERISIQQQGMSVRKAVLNFRSNAESEVGLRDVMTDRMRTDQ